MSTETTTPRTMTLELTGVDSIEHFLAETYTAVRVRTDATRWGFHSSSRFTQKYRATYDQMPNHTLHL